MRDLGRPDRGDVELNSPRIHTSDCRRVSAVWSSRRQDLACEELRRIGLGSGRAGGPPRGGLQWPPTRETTRSCFRGWCPSRPLAAAPSCVAAPSLFVLLDTGHRDLEVPHKTTRSVARPRSRHIGGQPHSPSDLGRPSCRLPLPPPAPVTSNVARSTSKRTPGHPN